MGKCMGTAVASVVDAQMRPEKIRVGEVIERCSFALVSRVLDRCSLVGCWSGVISVWSRCGLGVVSVWSAILFIA